MKIQTILSAAVLTAILSTAASAQTVLGSIDAYVAAVSDEAQANFTSFSANLVGINGSINITSSGSAGGSVTETVNDLSDTDTSTMMSGLSGTASSEAMGNAVAGGLIVSVEDLNCTANSSTGDTTAENHCAIGADTYNLLNTLSTDTGTGSTTTSDATQQNFGDVAASAIGAMNSATQDITETGASVSDSSAANTTNTAASAEFAATSGSGVSSLTFAINDGDIDGSVTYGLTGGNIDFDSIKATAVGSINTSDVTAVFVGVGFPGL